MHVLSAARVHLAEFGIITAQGPHKILALIRAIEAGEGSDLPSKARVVFDSLITQFDTLPG